MADDSELVRTAAGGDVGAFHALVDRHSGPLLRLAQWFCRNRADAEDAVQETLVAAFRGIRGFDGRASFKTWITRILMRQAAKQRARTWKHRGLALTSEGNGPPHDGPVVAEPAVESSTGQVDQRIDLAAGIESLPDDQRAVVLLREVHGMSYAEIAEALGIPRGTVESRLHRARLALRERLQSYLRS